jgi:hypothetical protein
MCLTVTVNRTDHTESGIMWIAVDDSVLASNPEGQDVGDDDGDDGRPPDCLCIEALGTPPCWP